MHARGRNTPILGYTGSTVQTRTPTINMPERVVTYVNTGRNPSCYVLPRGYASLASFRLYRLDGAGRIVSAEWLEADGDDHAQQLARDLKAETTVEIWDRNRMIARIEPPPKS